MNKNTPLTVTDVNKLIKNLLNKYLDDDFYIQGEVSACRPWNDSVYFQLKDENGIINAVHWGGNKHGYQNGTVVIIQGKIVMMENKGEYKLKVSNVEKAGTGNLHSELEKIKKDLEAKQYFSKKRPFPTKISKIGIVTALTGAVIHDMLSIFTNGKYNGEIYIKNCNVQGKACPSSVKNGIEYFNDLEEKMDILIIARGGGGFEDLIGYSSEEIVKALYESDIYTISAIGHEEDKMLSDLAADIRAGTPSIAAEMIIKIVSKEMKELEEKNNRIIQLGNKIQMEISNYETKIENLTRIHESYNLENMINNAKFKYENMMKDLYNKINQSIYEKSNEIDKLRNKNNAFDVTKTLENGYVMILDESGEIIDTIDEFKKNIKNLKFVFKDGNIDYLMLANIIN